MSVSMAVSGAMSVSGAEAAPPVAREPERNAAVQDLSESTMSQRPGEQAEFSSGAVLDARCVSGYASLTWAWRRPITEEGFLLRFSGGASRYVFTAAAEDAKGAPLLLPEVGVFAFTEALAGRQMNFGRLWLKAFAGLSHGARATSRDAAPGDMSGSSASDIRDLVAKGLAEAWIRLSDDAWLSADAAYAGGGAGYAATLRFGLQAREELTFGPEAGASGDRESRRARAGGFVSLRREGMELTVSGGAAFSDGGVASPYGALSVFRRF